MLCHDRLDRHLIEWLSFVQREFQQYHLVPFYTIFFRKKQKLEINLLSKKTVNRNKIQMRCWVHTVMVSTVRVLLLTVCVEMISPSAVNPELFSPRMT